MAKDLQVQEWLKRAADDEKSLRAILKDEEGSPSTACFLAQQMAEKFLKTYLISREKWYPRIHPLDALWEFSFRQAKDAFQKALIIKDFVLKRLHR